MNLRWLIWLCSVVEVVVQARQVAPTLHSVARHVQQRRILIDSSSSNHPTVLPEGFTFLDYLPANLDALGDVANITAECLFDLSMVTLALKNATLVEPTFANTVNQMMDAMGKVPPGMQRGAHTIFGFKQECDVVFHQFAHVERPFTTTYSRLFINAFALADPKASCDGVSTMIGLDVCLPTSCNKEDLKSAVKNLPLLGSAIPNLPEICVTSTFEETNYSFNWQSWIVLIVVIFFTVLGIISAAVDYYVLPESSPLRKAPQVEMFLAFSIYTNVSQIMSVSEVRPGQIGPLNCIRVFTILWVVLGHCFMYFMLNGNDFFDFYNVIDYPMTQIIMNAFFSVDSFFFIGSVLVSFIWFKELQRNRRATMSLPAWIMFYVHRILRLSPPYFICLFFYTYVMLPWFNNKQSSLTSAPDAIDPCREYSFYNVLYVNNLVKNASGCFPHSWYLATDMQMYVLSPIVLVTLALNSVLGLIVAGLLLALSTAGNVVSIYENNFPPTLNVIAVDADPSTLTNYTRFMYEAPWIRCQVYLMGLVVGWLLQTKKKLKIPPVVNLVGWALSAALMLTVLFGLYRYNNGHSMPIFWRAMYSALSKPAWALGLGWVIISCFYGYGGAINRFMSWWIWVPFGRLSYCMYLVHFPVMQYFYALEENPIYYGGIWKLLWNYFVPVAVISFAVALYVSAVFEVSIGKVESLIFRRKRPSSQENGKTPLDKDDWDVKTENTLNGNGILKTQSEKL